MANCAKCGKELKGFFEKRPNHGHHLPNQYVGKTICAGCNSELKTKYEQTQYELAEERRQQELFNKYEGPFVEALQNRNQTVVIEATMLHGRGNAQFYISFYSEIAEKYGFKFKDMSQTPSYLPSGLNVLILVLIFEKVSERSKSIKIVLDFTSLKEVMSKGGLVMSTYKCPNCNGMVKLPEAGKVLMCEYCGAAIKPIDIFEKIKSLIQ